MHGAGEGVGVERNPNRNFRGEKKALISKI